MFHCFQRFACKKNEMVIFHGTLLNCQSGHWPLLWFNGLVYFVTKNIWFPVNLSSTSQSIGFLLPGCNSWPCNAIASPGTSEDPETPPTCDIYFCSLLFFVGYIIYIYMYICIYIYICIYHFISTNSSRQKQVPNLPVGIYFCRFPE